MYSETYINQMEITSMSHMISIARDKGHTPREALERKEEGTLLDRLLREAVTPEEHALMGLIDGLIDELLDTDTRQRESGRTMRTRLRKAFTAMGFSERCFYAAFHGIEKRIVL